METLTKDTLQTLCALSYAHAEKRGIAVTHIYKRSRLRIKIRDCKQDSSAIHASFPYVSSYLPIVNGERELLR